MSENYSPEHNVESAPQESETLTAARKFTSFLEKVQDFDSSAVSLRTKEEAEEAKQAYIQRLLSTVNTIDGVEVLDLTLSGEGVVVPNMNISKVGDGEDGLPLGALIHIDREEPMRKLSIAEDISARFEGFWIDIKETGVGFRLATSLIVKIGEIHQYGINVVPDSPVSFLTVTASQRGIVALDGSSDITVDVIEMERIAQESKKIAKKYAKSPYVGGALGRYLSRLESALRSEDEKSFTELKHPRIIRALGRAGAESAAENPKATTIIEDSLLHRIGQNRQLQIVYNEKRASDEVEAARKYVNGRLLHVALMGIDSEDEITTQFVVDGVAGELQGEPEYGVHYIPLTEVKQFSF